MERVEEHVYRYLSSLVVSTLFIGTVFYHLVEKMSWLNSYYFSVTTLTTVGYGDLAPKTAAGKIFTTFYLLTGIGIITSFISLSLRRRVQIMKDNRDKRQSTEQRVETDKK